MKRAILVLSLLVAGAALAAPMKPEARAKLDGGLRHFSAKEWDAAIDDFRAGYAMDPQPDFLYAWGQAERLRGNCPEAVRLYSRYLASGVTAEQAKITADNLAKCHAAVGSETAPAKPAVPDAAPPAPSPMPAPASPTPENAAAGAPPAASGVGGSLSRGSDKSSWTSDTTGHILVGSGVVCLAAGTVLFLNSRSEANAAPGSATYAEYDDHIGAAKTRRTVAVVALGAGAALATAGMLHYLLVHPRAEVSAYVSPGGGGLAVAGRF